MTTTAQRPPRLTLDERHDRIIANLTQRLAQAARDDRPRPRPLGSDFLEPLLRPDLVDGWLSAVASRG